MKRDCPSIPVIATSKLLSLSLQLATVMINKVIFLENNKVVILIFALPHTHTDTVTHTSTLGTDTRTTYNNNNSYHLCWSCVSMYITVSQKRVII